MSLQDKVVLITGANSGIGADVARAFHTAGARVVLNGRRGHLLNSVADSIDGSGERVACVAGDIGRAETSWKLVSTALERFGAVDILFNNAGIFQPKPFLEHTREDFEGYLNLLRGYFFLSQAVVPEMRKGGGGAIVNTGSMWALHAIASTPCAGSSTAKGGVHALTRSLAIELAPDRIRVNAIAPAVVETPLLEPILTPEQILALNAFHPLGRNGRTTDVAAAVLFLADEDRSGWITGVVLPLDGGVTAGRNQMLEPCA